MKKTLLGLGIVLGTMASAQSATGPRFGIKAGGNLSTLTHEEARSKAGFHAGVFMNASVARNFNIQPEVVYSAQGATTDDKNNVKNNRYNLNYINVPIMLQYYAIPAFYLEAGPEFGFLVSARNRYEFEGETITEDQKQYTRSFNAGIGLGGGYRFTPGFSAYARFNAGLASMSKNNNGMKQNNFSLGVSYMF
ncbi:porin family protein [Niabella drilacis]|nr:porin family protein [Niabella drilacis]